MTNLTPIFKFSIHYGSRVISLRLCTSHPFLVWKLPRGRLCFFSVLYFFRRSSFSFHFTLFQCISFLSTFLSCALFSCPSIICSYPFIVPPCHVQILTDRIFGMHDLGHPGGHNLYVWILKKQIYTHTKAFSFVFVPFPFHFCSHFFHAFLLSCEFPFTSFHVPSISVNHIVISRSSYWNFAPFLLFFHVLLMFLWFSFPFVSFSFSSFFHVPFILLSCHFSVLPFFLQVMPLSFPV